MYIRELISVPDIHMDELYGLESGDDIDGISIRHLESDLFAGFGADITIRVPHGPLDCFDVLVTAFMVSPDSILIVTIFRVLELRGFESLEPPQLKTEYLKLRLQALT